ncbi:MAG: T9SS type A sorting domain-containing protein [Ignavibacteria bacterium]|nr:T9SS type A sorting domain-containing protein [Ignavibacteria bacterium]
MKKYLIGLSFVLMLLTVNFAQQWDGLITSFNINSITEDGDFLWLATDGGLVKYEKSTGNKVFYNRSNSNLPYNYVTSVAVEGNGNIWIGTWDGLSMFDGDVFTNYYSYTSDLPNDRISSLAFDHSGNLWIGTLRGIAKFDGENVQTFSPATDTAITAYPCETIAVDNNGNVWFGSTSDYYQQGGIYKYDGANWTGYRMDNSSIPDYMIRDIKVDSENNLWIATDNYGMLKFDGSTFEIFNQNSSGISDIRIKKIAIDQSDNVWTASEKYWLNGGVSKYNGTDFLIYTKFNGTYPTENSSSIFVDSDNKVWASADGIGLASFNGSTWTAEMISEKGIPSNYINAITFDGDNNLWIATGDRGIAKYSNSVWTIYDTSNSSIPHNIVRCIAVDMLGIVWAGTNDGIFVVNGDFTNYFTSENTNEIYGGWINDIAVDKNNKVYFANDYGVTIYDGENWSNLNKYNLPGYPETPVEAFTSVAIDNNNNLWFGLNGYGIIKFDGAGCTNYSVAEGLSYVSVQDLAVDASNNIWIATFGEGPGGNNGGLYKFDGSTFTNYRMNNSSSPANYLEFVKVDSDSNIWFGGAQYGANFGGGMARISSSGEWETLTFANSRIPYYAVKDMALDNLGNLYIASSGFGIAVYNPDGIAVSVEKTSEIANEFELNQNYPNPFNPSTMISYQLPMSNIVSLKIYDMLGREVATLVNTQQSAGNYEVKFDGSQFASGVYIYRIQAGEFTASKKLMLIK